MSWLGDLASRVAGRLVIDQLGRELDAISQALRSADAPERIDAVTRLRTIDDPAARALLHASTRDSAPGVRAAAAEALGRHGALDAVSTLAVLFEDAEASVREAAVDALDLLGAPTRARIELGEPQVGAPRDPRVPDLLARALRDADPAVRARAVRGLPRQGARGVELLRRHVESAADAERGPLLDSTLEALAEPCSAPDAFHRRAALEAVAALGRERALPALVAALSDESAAVRESAVAAVLALAPPDAFDDVLERTADVHENVACRAIQGLVAARTRAPLSPREDERLHERFVRLARHGEGAVQSSAVWALGEMREVRGVKPLLETLDEPSESLRAAACDALAKIADPRAVDPLVVLLDRDPSGKVREAAVRGLGVLGDVRGIPPLVRRLFGDPDAAVVTAADAALETACAPTEQRLRGEAGAAPSRETLARAAGDVRSVRLLLAAIVEGPPEVVRDAEVALSAMGLVPSALARSSLLLADQPEARRLHAIAACPALGLPDTQALLLRLVDDANEPAIVHRTAVATLARLGPPALDELRKRASGSVSLAASEAIAAALAPPAAPPTQPAP